MRVCFRFFVKRKPDLGKNVCMKMYGFYSNRISLKPVFSPDGSGILFCSGAQRGAKKIERTAGNAANRHS